MLPRICFSRQPSLQINDSFFVTAVRKLAFVVNQVVPKRGEPCRRGADGNAAALPPGLVPRGNFHTARRPRDRASRAYCAVHPAYMTNSLPFMKDDSSEARNSTRYATLSARPIVMLTPFKSTKAGSSD